MSEDQNISIERLVIEGIDYPIRVENGLYLTFVDLPINDDMGHIVIAKSKEALIKQVKASHLIHKKYEEWENKKDESEFKPGVE